MTREANLPIGKQINADKSDEIYGYSAGGNVLSIAPSSAGRYSATVAPALSSHRGAVLVFDPTGAIYQATAKRRAEMGAVVKLDPWGVVPDQNLGSFNPIDILNGLGMSIAEGARFLTEFIIPYHFYLPRGMGMEAKDPFWPSMQRKLLIGLITLVTKEAQNNEAIFSRVKAILDGEDVVYDLAKKLDDAGKQMDKEAYGEIAAFLQQADAARSGILGGVSAHFGAFGTVMARRATDSSSFDVGQWLRGENITIYIVGPPAGVTAYDVIYRLWLGSLLAAVLQRPVVDENRTLLVLDLNESFDLWPGSCTAIIHKRACQVWTIASSLTDLGWAFREYADSVLNSFSVIQALRPFNFKAAAQIGELLNLSGAEVMKISNSELWAMVDGASAIRLRRLDN